MVYMKCPNKRDGILERLRESLGWDLNLEEFQAFVGQKLKMSLSPMENQNELV